MNLDFELIRIDRIVSFFLLLFFGAFIVSGYGMTRGIMDRPLAQFIHFNLDIGLLLLASLHVTIQSKFFLRRHGVSFKDNQAIALLAIVNLAVLGIGIFWKYVA